MPRMTLAILSALPEEQQGVIDLLTDPPSGSPHARQHIRCGGRDFWCGHFASKSGPQPVVLALAGIGKVAAATTATVLVERFGAHGGRVARIILVSTALAFLSFSAAVALLVQK